MRPWSRSKWGMRYVLWAAAGLISLGADVVTKATPHALVINNYAHTPILLIILAGAFLCLLARASSLLVAMGAGLMFGALCGNAGQLLLFGYASDWLPVGGWLTNVADIAGAVGFICCCAGFARSAIQRRNPLAG